MFERSHVLVFLQACDWTYSNYLTYRDTCWSCHWTTCCNVCWGRAGAGCTGVGTRVRRSYARTEEDTRPVNLSNLCDIVNCGTTAVAWDAPRRSLPGVGHCHWGVYLCVHHCDAGEVEASGDVDTSGWGLCDAHTWSRNWARKKWTYSLTVVHLWDGGSVSYCIYHSNVYKTSQYNNFWAKRTQILL